MPYLAESSDPFRSLIEAYVSQTHRDNPGEGCVLPSLAANPACRSDPDLREQFTGVVHGYLDHLTKLVLTIPDTGARRDPAAILYEIVDAIVLSRAASDSELADWLVAAVTADIVGEVRGDEELKAIGAV